MYASPTAPPHVLVRLHRQLPRLADPLAVLLALALLRRTQQPPVFTGQVALLYFGVGQGHEFRSLQPKILP